MAYTKRPTRVWVPECRISNQEGNSSPSLETTISHRPSNGLISWAFIVVEKVDSTRNAAINKLDEIFIIVNLFLVAVNIANRYTSEKLIVEKIKI
jgi:hypothetical protein